MNDNEVQLNTYGALSDGYNGYNTNPTISNQKTFCPPKIIIQNVFHPNPDFFGILSLWWVKVINILLFLMLCTFGFKFLFELIKSIFEVEFFDSTIKFLDDKILSVFYEFFKKIADIFKK